jgi:hypothetical protein
LGRRRKTLLTPLRDPPPMDRQHPSAQSSFIKSLEGKQIMGRGILLWLLGVPLPIILLLAMCSHR